MEVYRQSQEQTPPPTVMQNSFSMVNNYFSSSPNMMVNKGKAGEGNDASSTTSPTSLFYCINSNPMMDAITGSSSMNPSQISYNDKVNVFPNDDIMNNGEVIMEKTKEYKANLSPYFDVLNESENEDLNTILPPPLKIQETFENMNGLNISNNFHSLYPIENKGLSTPKVGEIQSPMIIKNKNMPNENANTYTIPSFPIVNKAFQLTSQQYTPPSPTSPKIVNSNSMSLMSNNNSPYQIISNINDTISSQKSNIIYSNQTLTPVLTESSNNNIFSNLKNYNFSNKNDGSQDDLLIRKGNMNFYAKRKMELKMGYGSSMNSYNNGCLTPKSNSLYQSSPSNIKYLSSPLNQVFTEDCNTMMTPTAQSYEMTTTTNGNSFINMSTSVPSQNFSSVQPTQLQQQPLQQTQQLQLQQQPLQQQQMTIQNTSYQTISYPPSQPQLQTLESVHSYSQPQSQLSPLQIQPPTQPQVQLPTLQIQQQPTQSYQPQPMPTLQLQQPQFQSSLPTVQLQQQQQPSQYQTPQSYSSSLTSVQMPSGQYQNTTTNQISPIQAQQPLMSTTVVLSQAVKDGSSSSNTSLQQPLVHDPTAIPTAIPPVVGSNDINEEAKYIDLKDFIPISSHFESYLNNEPVVLKYIPKARQKAIAKRKLNLNKSKIEKPVPKIYKCKFCNKEFSRPYHMRSHFRSHTNQRPFQCVYCNRAFCRKHDLSRHERIHTGEHPYRCSKCLKGFTRSDACTRHIRQNLCENIKFYADGSKVSVKQEDI